MLKYWLIEIAILRLFFLPEGDELTGCQSAGHNLRSKQYETR
jgi:hypothetical protein